MPTRKMTNKERLEMLEKKVDQVMFSTVEILRTHLKLGHRIRSSADLRKQIDALKSLMEDDS